ncbi:SNF2-related protein [Saccharopolyspora sp. NPDC047091]|uniref:DEAD/DEAH box helicase n=1 Tax=Saccharopolyspora sp. NPDC047091 TaxID=3155924 RepID=UPI0033F7E6B0
MGLDDGPGAVRAGRAARAVLAGARSFRAAARGLLAEPDRLRERARRQYDAFRQREAWERLRAMPVGRLRDAARTRLRLGELERAGYRTVADVAAATPERLQAVPGVGPATAQEAAAAAARLARASAQDVVLRIDPDRRDPEHAALLATVRAWELAGERISAQQEEIRRGLAALDELEPVAQRTGSRLRMWFTGAARRGSALDALARLDGLLAEPGIRRVAAAAENSGAEPPAQLWRDYERRAATYNTLLAELTDHAGTGAAATGQLPPEQERQVTATGLDTGLLRVALRGYQAFGAKFALARRKSILGDEMGLGKTVEALAAMAHLTARGGTHFLVVCPAGVLINWVHETSRRSALVPHPLHGPHRDAATREWLRDGGVAVTSFDTLQRLHGVAAAPLAMVVVDEAHYVKNPHAQRSQAVVSLVARADRALLLTGTPMENRVEEFRTLVGYLQPELAARLDARDALAPGRFRRAVAPVYLRRNQDDVLTELPELIELEDWVELTGADDTAYRNAVGAGNLMAMRRAAYEQPGSAKLARLREIVEDAAQQEWKVVVFTFFRPVLAAVRDAVGPAAMPKNLDGDLTDKQGLVDEFSERDGHAVLLAQIGAGGTGLNIQAANVVVLAEPQLKPSAEEQAIARCHRMGQTRKVHVHRILAKDTVDQRLRELLDGKSRLFDAYARESAAKLADPEALNTRPLDERLLHDTSVPVERRIVDVERHRLGLTT